MNRSTDYLERLFIEELNSEGEEIIIRGSVFLRDQILSQLEPDTYELAFQEWKFQRKKEFIDKGVEILKLADNKKRFETLKVLFRKNKLIPFIGAGMSMPSGFPSWKDFLYDVQKESGAELSKFEHHLEKGEYEEAAQLLSDIDEIHLQEHLENQFGRTLQLDELQGVICRLPEFFKETIITTNYDNLLKKIYENQGNNFDQELIGLDAEEFRKLFGASQRILLKLHGSFASKNKRILTKRDYERHYSENNILKNCVMESLFSQSLLFLGCSLDKDRTLKCMAKIVEERGSDRLPKHYAFLSCENLSDEERTVRRKALQKSNIFPIWYDGDHDESIEALLELLNDEER